MSPRVDRRRGSRSASQDRPDTEELAEFDPSDRKFIAVASACEHPVEVLQATDSKWWLLRDALADAGIAVRFVCPQCIADLAEGNRKLQGGSNARTQVAVVSAGAPPVGRGDGLLQHEEELVNARLAGAVAAEENGQRGKPNPTRVLPRLEVADLQVGEHAEMSLRMVLVVGSGRA